MSETKPKFGPEQYEAGDIIIRQGDEPDKFYIITRGQVDVVLQPPDGLDEVIDELGPGDYFGEVGMVRRSLRMATVQAKTAVELMAMDYQTFMNWIANAPEVADEIDALIEERLLNATQMPEPFAEEEALATAVVEDVERGKTAVNATSQFLTGDTIIRQGETADTFYVIIEGFVTVSHTLPDGSEKTVDHLASGDYFGEIGLLDGSPRLATVTALTDVKLLAFDRDTFKNWMRKSPGSQDDLRREASRRRKDTGMLSLPEEG
jgi:cAMP-dependent protein kinase regulator